MRLEKKIMTSTTLYQSVATYLDEAETPYRGDPEGGVMLVDMTSEVGSWKMHLQITENEDVRLVVIHSELPAQIPEDNRLKVAELLTRINYDLVVGNFELGMEDGVVLFKTTLDLCDGQLTKTMFERMYDLNGHMFSRDFAKILSVGFSGVGEGGVAEEEDRPEGVMLQ
jgi:hypothetical protein